MILLAEWCSGGRESKLKEVDKESLQADSSGPGGDSHMKVTGVIRKTYWQ